MGVSDASFSAGEAAGSGESSGGLPLGVEERVMADGWNSDGGIMFLRCFGVVISDTVGGWPMSFTLEETLIH